jgi:hypothetical protein
MKCCTAKDYVALRTGIPYINRSRMSLLSCFLGRFLPKLGGTSVPPFFSFGG